MHRLHGGRRVGAGDLEHVHVQRLVGRQWVADDQRVYRTAAPGQRLGDGLGAGVEEWRVQDQSDVVGDDDAVGDGHRVGVRDVAVVGDGDGVGAGKRGQEVEFVETSHVRLSGEGVGHVLSDLDPRAFQRLIFARRGAVAQHRAAQVALVGVGVDVHRHRDGHLGLQWIVAGNQQTGRVRAGAGDLAGVLGDSDGGAVANGHGAGDGIYAQPERRNLDQHVVYVPVPVVSWGDKVPAQNDGLPGVGRQVYDFVGGAVVIGPPGEVGPGRPAIGADVQVGIATAEKVLEVAGVFQLRAAERNDDGRGPEFGVHTSAKRICVRGGTVATAERKRPVRNPPLVIAHPAGTGVGDHAPACRRESALKVLEEERSKVNVVVECDVAGVGDGHEVGDHITPRHRLLQLEWRHLDMRPAVLQLHVVDGGAGGYSPGLDVGQVVGCGDGDGEEAQVAGTDQPLVVAGGVGGEGVGEAGGCFQQDGHTLDRAAGAVAGDGARDLAGVRVGDDLQCHRHLDGRAGRVVGVEDERAGVGAQREHGAGVEGEHRRDDALGGQCSGDRVFAEPGDAGPALQQDFVHQDVAGLRAGRVGADAQHDRLPSVGAQVNRPLEDPVRVGVVGLGHLFRPDLGAVHLDVKRVGGCIVRVHAVVIGVKAQLAGAAREGNLLLHIVCAWVAAAVATRPVSIRTGVGRDAPNRRRVHDPLAGVVCPLGPATGRGRAVLEARIVEQVVLQDRALLLRLARDTGYYEVGIHAQAAHLALVSKLSPLVQFRRRRTLCGRKRPTAVFLDELELQRRVAVVGQRHGHVVDFAPRQRLAEGGEGSVRHGRAEDKVLRGAASR